MNNRHRILCLALCLLSIVLCVLKLLHIIRWSWWWVTAPLWGGGALLIIGLLLLLIGLAFAARDGKPI
ncbi:hypothetical protein [Rhodanobacter thiooxydans]|uniref:hypothetical protein n=1 Tax=Rhodanobacter thiooxydans TaxID=416169 RepID=UPI000260DE3C|nr:hypothetical protein [Rhodanobacter thiooxydans]EIL99155.1 hypothetical protein UUA_09116 [Rhodanobacter thiooxydans LCS2]